MAEKPNRWERHQNKKSRAKKERAKAKHFEVEGIEQDVWGTMEEVDETARSGIIAETRKKTFIVMENDEYFECKLAPGIPPALARQLVVGDKVRFVSISEIEGQILTREDRKNFLARMRGESSRISAAALHQHVIAANVDKAVIVAAAKDPEFHPRFVDRYLVVAQDGNVDPIICINKSDLVEEEHPAIDTYRKLGIQIIKTSVLDGRGIDELKKAIYGQICVLVGNSGVGKSSLANAIMPGKELKVGEVSKKAGRGRHTTASTSLHKWDEGSYLIDTPGIRALGIENISEEQIRYFFPEFEQFSDKCKFRDCLHDKEPECAVKDAVTAGDIDRHRYESYIRMLHE